MLGVRHRVHHFGDGGQGRGGRRDVTHRLVGRLYWLGVISGSGATTNGRFETEYGWRLTHVSWKGARPYVLGFKRQNWAPWHRIRRGHWPYTISLGLCGRCSPWPCCGAIGLDHAEGCDED